MLHSKKCVLFAVFVNAQLALASNECVDIWTASRCSMQKRKGNCVVCRVVELDASTSRSICSALSLTAAPRPLAPILSPTHARLCPTPEQPEAQCPNPKKDGIKCTRARSKCMATCRTCDDDSASSCADVRAELAELKAVCTSSPPPSPPGALQGASSPPPSPPGALQGASSPPPSPPGALQGADYPCDKAYNLLTLTEAYDWCATHCEGRTVKVITDDGSDVDFSDESGGVCAIGDTTDSDNFFDDVEVTLTEHDDCFVLVVVDDAYGFGGVDGFDASGQLLGLDGNDVLCGGSGNDHHFYGGDGDDLVAAGPGDDGRMFGDAGDDKIFGGDGSESYYGSPLLFGDEGADSIYADPGDDAFLGYV